MRWLVMGYVLAATATTALAAPSPWSIDVPSTWQDVTEDWLKEPAVIQQRQALVAANAYAEMKFYTEGNRLLQVTFTRVPHGNRMMVEGFEKGAHGAVTRDSTAELSYSKRVEGKTLVADQAVTMAGGPMAIKRIAGIEKSSGSMIAVQVVCRADAAVCAPILATVALDPASLGPLANERSTAYQLGRLVGMGLVIGLVVAVLVAVLRRKQAAAG